MWHIHKERKVDCTFEYGQLDDGKKGFKKWVADMQAHNTPIVMPDGTVLKADNWTMDTPPVPYMFATIEEPQPGTQIDIQAIARRVNGAIAREVAD